MPREENIADFALEAIIQSQHECNYSSQLNTLLDTCELLQERIPGYRVKIGFGLHAGWAVEGALGSKHKIDCTYLGPHQDMSERLETATKLYGTPVLTTDSFYVLLSAQRQRTMRIVDRVLQLCALSSFLGLNLVQLKIGTSVMCTNFQNSYPRGTVLTPHESKDAAPHTSPNPLSDTTSYTPYTRDEAGGGGTYHAERKMRPHVSG